MYERISINCCHCYFNEYKETNIKDHYLSLGMLMAYFKRTSNKMEKNELLINIYKIHTTSSSIPKFLLILDMPKCVVLNFVNIY